MKKYIIIGMLFIVAIILILLFNPNPDYVKTGNLYLNEIVTSNKYTYKDNDGEFSDYIEIYNGYDHDMDLDGYYLTDSLYEMKKWTIKNVTIKAHEYLIIFASGKNKCNENVCHTNFKLKSDGETISLIDKTGNIISRVKYPEMSNDLAYSYIKGKYVVTLPTPGKENTEDEIPNVNLKKYKILINEYLSHNKGSSYASNGSYYDWVELYNDTEENLSLLGLSLSDDASNLNKFMMPNITIKAHEYLIVYLTGGEEVDGIYANFKLSDNDEKILLSSNGKIIDEVEVVKLDKNVSYGRNGNKWLYFLTPTPGKANATFGVERLDE